MKYDRLSMYSLFRYTMTFLLTALVLVNSIVVVY